MVSDNPPLDNTSISYIDMLYRDRLRSLLPVDDMIGAIYSFLDKHKILDNTYLIYASDHGYHLGQWRIPCSKQQMYETDIRIPFFIRPPNSNNSNSNSNKYNETRIVGNVDLLPTLLELAGISIPSIVDGYSFADLFISDTHNNNNNNINQVNHEYEHNKQNKHKYLNRNHKQLKNNKNQNKKKNKTWRTTFLSEYRSVTTSEYGFSHCGVWVAGDGTFIGQGYTDYPPDGDSEGRTWEVDSGYSNNWRMLRIINTTHNLAYGEFVAHNWSQVSLNNPMLYELYDINNDPFQIYNIYYNQTNNVKIQLTNMLKQYGSCAGTSGDTACP